MTNKEMSGRRDLLLANILLALVLLFGIAKAEECEYQTWNRYGDGSVTGRGPTPQAACEDHTSNWIASSGIDVSLYGGYPTSVASGVNCLIQWPAGQENYTWIRNSCGPEQYFVLAQPEIKSDSGDSCSDDEPSQSPAPQFVADPINPAIGSVVQTEGDCSARTGVGSLSYRRFYSSTNDSAGSLGTGWRGSFSRRVSPNSVLASVTAHNISNPDHSSLYNDPASACTSGFAQIQSRVASWAGATALYENELCKVIKNARVIALIPIRKSSGVPMVSTTPTIFDVVRDDGQVIRFWTQSGALRSSAGVTLRLMQTTSGFEIHDGNDTVERYNTGGILLSITTRAGVVQTMSYDTSGRLSTVTDSFGHRLVFGYDAQNRLISVTRQ